MALKVAGIPKRQLLEGMLSPASCAILTGNILELWKFAKTSGIPNTKFLMWMSQLTGNEFSQPEKSAVLSKVRRMEQRLSKLRGHKLEDAKKEQFDFAFDDKVPKKRKGEGKQESAKKSNTLPQDSASDCKTLPLSPTKTRCSKGQRLRLGTQRLCLLLRQSYQRNQKTCKLLSERRRKVITLIENNKQTKRKHETLKRKHIQALSTIEDLKQEAKRVKLAVKEEKQSLKEETSRCLTEKVTALKAKCKHLSAVNIQQERKVKMLTTENSFLKREKEALNGKMEDLEQQVKILKEENSDLQQSVDYLSTLVQDAKEVDLYDETAKKFTTETMQCAMNLTTLGVASRNVGPVIKEVLTLVQKEANRLPARTTVDDMNDSKLAVAQKQLKSIATENKKLCLQTDETSKRGVKSNVYIVTDEDDNSYMLGLRQMATKSAATVLDTFKEILEDISQACANMEHTTDITSNTGYNILAEINSTMSDRAASEKLFNKLLEEYREGFLPVILREWPNMSDEAKEHTSKLHNFYCGLHLLVAFADVATGNLGKFEGLHMEGKLPNISTVNLIRMCAKAFSRGGDEKSGCFVQWKTFLDTEKCKHHFFRFSHNRFNVVFVLAKIVYFHHHRIQHFLEHVFGANNLLLQSILRDIQVPVFIEGCRVLGLMSDLITAPFWRVVESCKHVLGLNVHYRSMQQFLREASEDPSDFLSGKSPFGEDCLHRDEEKSQCLLQGAQESQLATQIAKGICLGLLQLLERMVPDQLEGGKYFQPTQEVLEATTSVPTHNKLPEFAFGILDRLVSFRPNATMLANEAYIMFGFNKTGDWLRNLPWDERDRYLQEARTEGRKLRTKFKERLKEIEKEQQMQLQKRQQELARAEANRIKKMESLTSDVVHYGLWQSRQDMELALEELVKEPEQRKSIQAQLKFRKDVLHQKHEDKKIFNVTKQVDKKSKKLSLEEMKANLMKLIDEAADGTTTETPNTPSQPLLVGKHVKHKFADGKVYDGQVISVVPGFPEWYNILYAGDEAIYSYKLQEDYKGGDLRIVPHAVVDTVPSVTDGDLADVLNF